ncbi:MAG: histidine phosphatase family protein [Zetaproteobacteria bacterium]|nr:MAG: histidine phosphatase family protein [Zetaproteobacteria bacterium]
MLTLDLLRHGELVGGVRYRGTVDDPLTPNGRLQMERVWRHIADEIDIIVASPLARCAEPARAWAEARRIPYLLEPRLRELAYGDWEGLTAEQIEARWPGMLQRWRDDPSGMCPPGGERPEALQARIMEWWRSVTERFEDGRLLVVAHSGSLRMLLAIILQAPIATTRRLHMPYACWSRVGYSAGHAPWLEFFNRTP